jgi:hypothetical protein
MDDDPRPECNNGQYGTSSTPTSAAGTPKCNTKSKECKPSKYRDVQQFVKEMAAKVNAGLITDLEAMRYIIRFSYSQANGDLRLALSYASSSFYRPELGTYGNAKDFNPNNEISASFGISGFSERYYGIKSNTNQLQHFIGEADIMATHSLPQVMGNIAAYVQDPGNDPEALADRQLGQMASWWVASSLADPTKTLLYLDQAINAIGNGSYIP